MKAIAQAYANLIKKGKKVMDQVPKEIKPEVEAILGGNTTTESDAG